MNWRSAASAIRAIAGREFKRFFRQKGRLWSSLARPLFWLFVVGPGLEQLLKNSQGISYQQFLFPGVLGLTVLFGSMLSSLSTVYDREFGIMKTMLMAPVSRSTVVLAKITGGSLLSVFQALLLLILAPVLRVHAGSAKLLLMPLCLLLVSFAIASVGMVLAARIESLENFSTIMNFVVFPMFFLSGGLYPVRLLPDVLRIVVYLNPLTYGIDLFKHVLLPDTASGPLAADFPVLVDTAALLIVSVVAGAVAIQLFDKEAKLVKLARKTD
jgi:ABC-2 type transport system permease protein